MIEYYMFGLVIKF